ncbi:MAG: elongation factor 1-beta [Candidatus Thermoplasmatota archaeon]|nr:elongation factor 1-beta [Candidatus Thermoplasmatota archaeon]
MGDVAVVLKILPSDSDVNVRSMMSAVEQALKGVCELNKIEEQEVAFGLKAIRLEVIVPDEEGKIGAVESRLQAVDGVGQVDTDEVTLV